MLHKTHNLYLPLMPDTSPRNNPWKLIAWGWLAGAGIAAVFGLVFFSGFLGIDLYSGDMALIPLIAILGMMGMLVMANYFWCKIPLPLKTCRQLGLLLLIPFPILLLPHPEVGWKSMLLFMELGQGGVYFAAKPGHMVMVAWLIAAVFVYHLAPWFTRRFFFEHLPDDFHIS